MADKYVKKNEIYIYADDDQLVHNLEEVEGLVESSGEEDAGKIPALDPTGKFDSSLFSPQFVYDTDYGCYVG